MMKKLLVILLTVIFILQSCDEMLKTSNADSGRLSSADCSIDISNDSSNLVLFAQNFKINTYGSGYKLQIKNNSVSKYDEFYLFDKSFKVPEELVEKNVIRTPINSAIAFSSTQWAVFQILGKLDVVKGILESSYSKNTEILKLVEEGEIADLGTSNSVDVEQVIDLHVDLILYTPYPTIDYSNLGALSGSAMMPFPDYLESHPLGRAEWMKVIGLLCGREKETAEWFDAVVNRYESLCEVCIDVKNKPTVFSDLPFENQWYVPGGDSYIAKIFNDAGGDYIWKDDNSTGSLHVDAESVLMKAQDADYWRVINSYDTPFSYDMLKNDNELYPLFKSFKNRNLLVCDVRETGYFEQSQYEPDVLLADFIYHFHPELLMSVWENYTPKYFKKLIK